MRSDKGKLKCDSGGNYHWQWWTISQRKKTSQKIGCVSDMYRVCSYVVSMEGTFDNMFACECRGIVFNENGFVISRPLHKIFNVGEKETTRV